ncbi:phosphodiesterase [Pseudomonas sp. PDNC002]|uniref:phosphodiesterase n=1 Tax=Pseudomonas sp. PDNC002 TaxID=2811422 RepID=UPI0019654176|nr:phosphodiesterase [Pseudomonas sp. PDNC002]QRY78593.1 phosphodiesterase [Pseudomonas sp. PDNC002]
MRQLLLLLCLAVPLPLLADTIEIPVGDQGDPHIVLPARGESQKAVLERFGLPDEEHPAVGKPPISRWDYREFSVYFESGHVVDAVRQHRSQYLKDLSPKTPSPKEPQ